MTSRVESNIIQLLEKRRLQLTFIICIYEKKSFACDWRRLSFVTVAFPGYLHLFVLGHDKN